MTQQHQFFLERAAEARRDASVATLDNVRERCLRAEAAWLDMAGRVERTERMRAKAAAEKALIEAAPSTAIPA